MPIKIYQVLTKSSLRNFTYIIQCSKDHAYCLDPYDAEEVMDFIERQGLKLRGIINTHEHWDHTQGNAELVRATQCDVYAHENGKEHIPCITHAVNQGEKISLGEKAHLLVLDTPGHTMCHLSLLLINEEGEKEAIFTGDTLFNAGVGNCTNGGDPSILFETLRDQYLTLPDSIKIYPGHEYWENNLKFTLDREPGNLDAKEMIDQRSFQIDEKNYLVSTLGLEKKVNVFFRLSSDEVKAGLENSSDEKDCFLSLRERRNHW